MLTPSISGIILADRAIGPFPSRVAAIAERQNDQVFSRPLLPLCATAIDRLPDWCDETVAEPMYRLLQSHCPPQEQATKSEFGLDEDKNRRRCGAEGGYGLACTVPRAGRCRRTMR